MLNIYINLYDESNSVDSYEFHMFKLNFVLLQNLMLLRKDVSNVLQQVITIAINIHFSNKLFTNDLMSFYSYKKYKGLDE